MVAAVGYSAALGEEALRGWRLVHVLDEQPAASAIALMYCDSGRCMNGNRMPGDSSSMATSSGR